MKRMLCSMTRLQVIKTALANQIKLSKHVQKEGNE